ncbi:hypothetical protein NQ315_014011 [Exocentrus adspersus]|uniref:DUF4371 domain-containing protein n=1 Tax=Exocentrus adspersus TaxID=1586481 RepID=A0AAV8V6N1_9CUCU|nr:hypothetical protein NQ315_014011 [Exocentrus adspersus]
MNPIETSNKKTFQKSWLDDPILKIFVEIYPNDSSKPSKLQCKICNKIINAGKSELTKHAEGKGHIKNMKLLCSNKKINDDFTVNQANRHSDKVKEAELHLCYFFAEHNVAINIVEHLIPLLQKLFTDPKVLADVTLGRTKCTEIIKNILANKELDNTVSELRVTPFSVLIDESTDITDQKNLCILVRYVNRRKGKAETKLLELLRINAAEGTAEKLYNEFKKYLESHNIPLKNIVGLACDGYNLMVGVKNSFYSHLKKDVPHALLIQCICHSAAIVASKACEELPRSTEEILRLTYSYVSGSAKDAKY